MRSRWLVALPAARVMIGIIGFLSTILTARALGPAEFGLFSTGLAIATVAVVLGPWGVDQLQIFHGLDERTARWASRRVFAITVGAGLLLAALWPSLSVQSRLCAIAAVVGMAARILLGPWLTGSLLRLEIGARIRRELGTIALSGVVGLAVAVLTRSALGSWLSIAIFLLCVAGVTGKSYADGTEEKRRFRSLIRSGLPYALSAAAYTLYFSIDVAILASISGVREVGQYRAASVIFAAALVVPIALNNDLLRASLAKGRERHVRIKVMRRFGVATLLAGVCAYGCLVAGYHLIVEVAYGPAYGSSEHLLWILSFALVPSYINSWLANVLVSEGEIRWVASIQAVLTVVNVATNVVVIPQYGARGAAWTTVATELIALTIYAVFFVQRVVAPGRIAASSAVRG